MRHLPNYFHHWFLLRRCTRNLDTQYNIVQLTQTSPGFGCQLSGVFDGFFTVVAGTVRREPVKFYCVSNVQEMFLQVPAECVATQRRCRGSSFAVLLSSGNWTWKCLA